MSFPRAKIQRFNETPTCSPAPGTYDPKLGNKVKAPLMRKETKTEGELLNAVAKPTAPNFLPTFRTPQLPRKATKNSNCKSQGRERRDYLLSVDDLALRGKAFSSSCSDLTELESLRQRLNETIDELNRTKDLCESLNFEIISKTKLVENLQQKNEVLAADIEVLHSNLVDAYSSHEKNLTDLEACDSKFLMNVKEVNSVVDELIEKYELCSKEMGALREELDNLGNLKFDLEQKVLQKQQMILLLQSELSTAEVELVECRSECERISSDASERKAEVESLKNIISEMECKMEDTDKELRSMRDNLMNGSVVRETLEEQLSEKQEAYWSLETSYERLLEECDQLKRKHCNEIQQLNNMIHNIEFTSKFIENKTENLQDVCNERLFALEDKVKFIMENSTEHWQNEIDILKKQLHKSTAQLQQVQMDAYEKIVALTTENEIKDKEGINRIKGVEAEARIITEKLLRAEEELRRVTDHRDELRMSNMAHQLSLVELQDRVDMLTVERDAASANLSSVTEECDSLKSQNKKLMVGNRNLNETLEALRVRLLESEADVEELTAVKNTLEADKHKLELDLKIKLKELEEQRLGIAQIEAENLQQIECVRRELLEKLDSFKQRALFSSEELQKVETEKQKQIETLSVQLEQFRQEFEILNKYVAAMEQENERQAEKLASYEEKHGHLEEAYACLSSKFDKQTMELEQRSNELSTAQGKICSQEEQILEFKCHIEQLSADIETSEIRIYELNEALNSAEESNADHEREIEALTEKLDHQRDCAKVATQQIANLEARNTYLDHQLQSLNSELERHKEYSHQATDHMLGLVNSSTEKDRQIESLVEEMESLKENMVEINDKVEALEGQLTTEKNKVQECTEEIKLLEADRFVKEEQLKELASDLQQYRTCEDSYAAEIAALENVKLEKQEELLEAKFKIDALEGEKATIEQTYKEIVADLEEVVQKHKEEKLSLEEKLSQSTAKNKDFESMKADLELEIHELARKCKDLEEQSQEWKKRFQEMESLIGPFKEQLEAFRAECKVLELEKGEVEGEMRQLASQYADILGHQNHKQKIRHLQQLKQQNLEYKEEIRTLKRTVEKLRKEIASVNTKASSIPHTPLASKGKENMGQSPVRKSPVASPTPKPFAERPAHKNVL